MSQNSDIDSNYYDFIMAESGVTASSLNHRQKHQQSIYQNYQQKIDIPTLDEIQAETATYDNTKNIYYSSIQNRRDVSNIKNENISKKRRSIKKMIKNGATKFKEQIIIDINIIDRYSRVFFPTLFFLFNILYWSYYLYQSSEFKSHLNERKYAN
jgi:hypothetical protein